MSLKNIFKKREKETQLNNEIKLRDNFQFDFNDISIPVPLDPIIKSTNEIFKNNNWLDFNETKPAASLWYVELIMDAIFNAGGFGKIENLIFNEVGFPEVSRKDKKKKKSEPKLEILDSYPINFEMTADYVHLPQIIAYFFMNIKNDQVNYEGRKEYIENILSFYDKTYGELFKKRFGLLPSQSVQLPSEDHWTSKYGYENPVDVKGLIKQTEIEPEHAPQSTVKPTKQASNTNQDPKPVINNETSTVAPVAPEQDKETNFDKPNISSESFATEKPKELSDKPEFGDVEPVKQNLNSQKNISNSFSLESMFNQLDNLRTSANVQPETLLVQNLAPVSDKSDNYVPTQLDIKRKELNEVRLSAADSLNASAEQKLGSKIDEFKRKISEENESFDENNNAETKAHDIVDPQIDLEKQDSEATKVAQINQSNAEKVEQENARHQTALSEIATNTEKEIETAKQNNETHYELLRNEKVNQMVGKIQSDLDTQKVDKLSMLTDEFVSQIKTLSADINKSSSSYMNQLLTKQNAELEKFENLQLQIHAEAEKRAVALDKLGIATSRAENLSELLKTKNEELAEKDNSLDVLREELASLKATNRTLESSNLTSDKVNQFLASKEKDFTFKDYLELQKLEREENAKSKTKGLKIALVSLISLIVLGGMGAKGFGLYSANQKLQTQNQIALQKTKAASDKQARLEEKINKEKQEKTAQKQAESKATQLQKLDAALDNGDLSVYQKDFKDNELGNNPDRVLKVGQLLVQNGQRDDAIKLAKANPESNRKLNQYLGI